jgi:hypothetical protein
LQEVPQELLALLQARYRQVTSAGSGFFENDGLDHFQEIFDLVVFIVGAKPLNGPEDGGLAERKQHSAV